MEELEFIRNERVKLQNIYLKVTKDLDDETSLPLNPNEEIVVEKELSKLVD